MRGMRAPLSHGVGPCSLLLSSTNSCTKSNKASNGTNRSNGSIFGPGGAGDREVGEPLVMARSSSRRPILIKPACAPPDLQSHWQFEGAAISALPSCQHLQGGRSHQSAAAGTESHPASWFGVVTGPGECFSLAQQTWWQSKTPKAPTGIRGSLQAASSGSW